MFSDQFISKILDVLFHKTNKVYTSLFSTNHGNHEMYLVNRTLPEYLNHTHLAFLHTIHWFDV